MAEEQRSLSVRIQRPNAVRRDDIVTADVDDALLRVFYVRMARIRAFEMRVADLVAAGTVADARVNVGLEAVAIGACTAMRGEDFLVSTDRPHGHLLAKGVEPRFIFAELLALSGGLAAGKAGSRFLADPRVGVLGSFPNGEGLPIAVGAALSCRSRGTEQIVVAMVDESAVQTGALAESVALARRWRLPVVFIHERIETATGLIAQPVVDTAPGWGIPAAAVDGGDPVVVFRVVSEAVGRARAGDGPSLIEAPVRWPRGRETGGTMMDPIGHLGERLRGFGLLTIDDEQIVEARAREEMDEAFAWAESSPVPDSAVAFREVYGRPIDPIYPLIDGGRRVP